MKDMRRKILSLFLCLCLLAAFLPAGVLSAPLKDYDEAGLYYTAIRFQTGGYLADENPMRASDRFGTPGSVAIIRLVYVIDADTDEEIFLTADDLIVPEGLSVSAIKKQNGDIDPTYLQFSMDRVGEFDVYYKRNGAAVGNPLRFIVKLPEFGFYSRPLAEEQYYLTAWDYLGSDSIMYLVSQSGLSIDAVTSQNDNVISCSIPAGGDGTFMEVKLTSLATNRIVVKVTSGSRTYNCGVNVTDRRPALLWRYARFDQASQSWVSNTDVQPQSRSVNYHPDTKPVLEFFYRAAGGDPEPVSFADLTFSGSCVTTMPVGDFTRLNIQDFGEFTVSYQDVSLVMYSTLPGIAFYSKPEATEANYLRQWDFNAQNNTAYLIDIDGGTITGEVSITQGGSGQVSLSEDKTMVTVKLDSIDGSVLVLSYTWKAANGMEIPDCVTSVRMIDATPGLVRCWPKWDSTDWKNVPHELSEIDPQSLQKTGITNSPNNGDSWEFFWRDENGALTRLTAADLTVSGTAFAISDNDGLVFIDYQDFGEGAISYKGTSIPVAVVVPEGGFFSSPEKTEESYITSHQLYNGEAQTLYYFVATPGDLVITELTANNNDIAGTIGTGGAYIRIEPADGGNTTFTVKGNTEHYVGGVATTNFGVSFFRSHLEITAVPAKAATYSAAGNIAHYKDADGNLYLLPDYPYAANEVLTRAKVCQFLMTAFDWKVDTEGVVPYTDVPASLAEYDAIMTLTKKRIVNGVSEGEFLPDNPLTRAELATIITRCLNQSGFFTQKLPGDVPETHWAAGYIGFCLADGILSTDADGLFQPGNQAVFGDIDLAALLCWTHNKQVSQADVTIPALTEPEPEIDFPYVYSAPSTTTETTTNEDGSKTTTVTAADGTVTETTENVDGSKVETVTNTDGSTKETVTETDGSTRETLTAEDGSAVTTSTAADGSTATVKTDAEGKVTEASAEISAEAIAAAAENEETQPITLALEMTAAKESEEAVALAIAIPEEAGSVAVEIPVKDLSPSSVVVLVHEDGTEEILPKTKLTEDGLAISLEGKVSVKIVDNEKTFTDTADLTEAEQEAVSFVTARALYEGVGNDKFAPEVSMNRFMFATVMHRLESKPDAESVTTFADVAEGEWYSEGVTWAAEKGIIMGYSENDFGGADPVTREQIALMLWRYFDKPEVTELVETSAHDWAAEAMSWAVANGLFDADVDAAGEASRVDVAVVLQKFINMI